MNISEDRFKSIVAGTATLLTSKEILIRQAAFDAERRGEDPMLAVETTMPDVTIVRAGKVTGTIPPLEVLLENIRKKKQGTTPSEATSSFPADIAIPDGTTTKPVVQAKPVAQDKQAAPGSSPSSAPDKSELFRVGAFWAVYVLGAGALVWVGVSAGLGAIVGKVASMAVGGLIVGLVLAPLVKMLSPVGQAVGSYVVKVGPFILGVIGFFTLLHWIGAF